MQQIPIVLLFIITTASVTLRGLIRNYYCKKVSSSIKSQYVFNSVSALVCALMLLILGGFELTASPFTILCGVIYGAVVAVANVSFNAALSMGPWSYTNVIMALSTVFTALSGAIFWNERITFRQIVGAVLMLVCLVFSVKKDTGEKKNASLKWFLVSMISCAACGGVGLMQKVHQSSEFKSEISIFLVVAFIFSALFSAVTYGVTAISEKKRPPRETPGGPPPAVKAYGKKLVPVIAAVFVFSGVFEALNNYINLYLCGVLPSVIFFPIVNGSDIFLSTLLSLTVFRERLTARQWVGLVCGAVAVFLLCM